MPIAEYRLAVCDRCGERVEVRASLPGPLHDWVEMRLSSPNNPTYLAGDDGLPHDAVLCPHCRRNFVLWFKGSGVFQPPSASG